MRKFPFTSFDHVLFRLCDGVSFDLCFLLHSGGYTDLLNPFVLSVSAADLLFGGFWSKEGCYFHLQ